MSCSSKKAKRLLALEARAKGKGPTGEKKRAKDDAGTNAAKRKREDADVPTVRRRRSGSLDTGMTSSAEPRAAAAAAAASTSGRDAPNASSLLYATFDGVTDVFPWLDDDHDAHDAHNAHDAHDTNDTNDANDANDTNVNNASCAPRARTTRSKPKDLNAVVHALLQTNHRYNKSSSTPSGIVDKMKEKTLLLENPVGQRTGKNSRQGAFYAPRGVRTLSHQERKALGLTAPKATYADALVLHGLWRAYRDEVMAEPTESRQQELERIWGLERVGSRVEVLRQGCKPLVGIVLEASGTSLHVIEATGKVRVVDTRSSGCEVRVEVDGTRVASWKKSSSS